MELQTELVLGRAQRELALPTTRAPAAVPVRPPAELILRSRARPPPGCGARADGRRLACPTELRGRQVPTW